MFPNEVVLYTATAQDMADGYPSISRATIDRQTAIYILENHNHDNRKIGRNVEIYIEAMKKGQWQFNGDTLRFDVNGRLLDGQTRLTAIANTGIPQTFLILRGLSASVHSTIDSGKSRTSANKFEFEHGHLKDSSPMMKAIKSILLYKQGICLVGSGVDKKYASDDDCLQFYQDNFSELMGYLWDCNKIRKTSTVMSLADMIFLMFIFSELDKTLAKQFVSDICTGANQMSNNATTAFQLLFKNLGLPTKARDKNYQLVYSMIIAWNRDRTGTKPYASPSYLLWKNQTPYPIAI